MCENGPFRRPKQGKRPGRTMSPRSPGKVLAGIQSRFVPAVPGLRLLGVVEFRSIQRRAGNQRLSCSLLFSVVFHVLLLKITFAGQGWFPALGFPWLDRRAEAELRVVLTPASPPVAEPVAMPL